MCCFACPFPRSSEDLGAGLFDTEFNTLCESESTPMHVGSIPGSLRGIDRTLDDNEWNVRRKRFSMTCSTGSARPVMPATSMS